MPNMPGGVSNLSVLRSTGFSAKPQLVMANSASAQTIALNLGRGTYVRVLGTAAGAITFNPPTWGPIPVNRPDVAGPMQDGLLWILELINGGGMGAITFATGNGGFWAPAVTAPGASQASIGLFVYDAVVNRHKFVAGFTPITGDVAEPPITPVMALDMPVSEAEEEKLSSEEEKGNPDGEDDEPKKKAITRDTESETGP